MIPPYKKDRKDADTLEMSSSIPADGVDNVAVNSTIRMTFNGDIQAASVTSSTIKVEQEV